MSASSTTISLSGNNKQIVSGICSYKKFEDIHFSEINPLSRIKYYLYLIDLEENLESASHNLIDAYDKCRENKSKLIVCLIFGKEIKKEKVFYFQKLLNELGKEGPLHRLVITKDLYFEANKPVTSFDKEIRKIFEGESINISSKGNNIFYPLHVDDFVLALTKIFFLNSTNGKTLYLAGEPVKDLEFAYQIKKIVIDQKPNFQINSTEENLPHDSEYQNLSNNTQIDINWRPALDFETSLKKIYQQELQTDLPQADLEVIPEIRKNHLIDKISNLNKYITSIKNYRYKPKTVRKNYILIKLVGIFIGIYLSVIGLFIITTYYSFKYLSKSLDELKQGRIENSVSLIKKSHQYNNLSLNIYWSVSPLTNLFSKNTNNEIHNTFSFSQYLLTSLENLQQSYVLGDKIFQSIVDSSVNVNILDQTLALKTSLAQVYDNVQQIEIMVNSNSLPAKITEKIKNDRSFKEVSIIEEQLSEALKLINLLPIVVSDNQSKKIAILIQDQDEIRSLGGVIKNLVTIDFSKNKISEIKVFNTKDIDSLSDGSAKAPETIAAITGSEYWKFRDMTYFSDVSQTSQYLSWYLEKYNLKPNAIIIINKSFFESLIQENGSIDISGNTITADKLKEKIGELDSGILQQIIDYYISQYRSKKLTLALVGRVVTSEISKGNIFVWSDDQEIESSISTQPFSGVIVPYRCHGSLANYEMCINQTTYLTESNFSVAPINQVLKRDLIHKVLLNQNFVSHEYLINYHFQTDISYLNRDYRLVYQLYAPAGSNIESIIVDDQILVGFPLVHQKYGQFEFFQMPIALTTNQDHNVSIKFTSPVNMIADLNKTAFSLTEIRQSGVQGEGYGLIITLPENTHARLVTSPVDLKPQQVYFRFPPKTTTFGLGLGLSR